MAIQCTNCGGWNVETEARCGACNRWLKSSERKTRQPKHKFVNYGRKPGLRSYNEDVIAWPAEDSEGNRIWSGERKDLGGFSEKFVEDFLTDYYGQKKGLNPKGFKQRIQNGTNEYQCSECEGYFARKKDAPGANNWLSIDHDDPIRDYVMHKSNPKVEYVHGHLWEFYLLEECKTHHLDRNNLEPMCQSCNSAKNGTKELDGDMRTHDEKHCRKCKKDAHKPY